MSHLRQRKENNCLNCGVTVLGRFCQNCGQENVEPKETVWHFLNHFLNDITHFDGKFFTTLKDLLFKPGYLSKEYMLGKRMKYLNPVRMYLFTSFIFFLILFSIFHVSENEIEGTVIENGKRTDPDKMNQKEFADFTSGLNHGKPLSRESYKNFIDSVNKVEGIHLTTKLSSKEYESKAQYDSFLRSGKVKDGWLTRKMTNKGIELNQKYKGKSNSKFLNIVITNLIHNFPQLLFISLPFVALFLKLFYIRHKLFYFVSHAIFIIHFYIFVFIMMLLSIALTGLEKWTNWDWISWINGTLVIVLLFYLYKAMRNFYQQRRPKTILKYFLLLFSFTFLITFLVVVFFVVSVFQA